MEVKYLRDILAALPPCLDIRDYYVYRKYDSDTTYFEIDIENMPLNVPGLYRTKVSLEKDHYHPKNYVSLKIENFIHTLDGDVLLQAETKLDDFFGKRSYLIDHIKYLVPEVFDKIYDPLIKHVNNMIQRVKKEIRESSSFTEIIHDKKLAGRQKPDWQADSAAKQVKHLEKLERLRDKLIHPAPLKD